MPRLLAVLSLAAATVWGAPLGAAQEPAAPAPPQPAPAPARYQDITTAAGLDGVVPARVALRDLNGDGFPEALVHGPNPGRAGHTPRLFENVASADVPGGRAFVERTSEWHFDRAPGAGGEPKQSESSFAVTGDVNNDGRADCFRAVYNNLATHEKEPDTGERSVILLGTAGGTFTVRADAGVAPAGPVTTCSAVLVDVNNDGNLDLFTGNWYREYGKSLEGYVNRLYLGNGDGTFTDATEAAGLLTVAEPAKANSSRPTYGVSHGDIDDDGWQDLIVASYGRRWDRVWHNNGDGTFTDWGPKLGVDGDAIRHGKYPAWLKAIPRFKDRADEQPFRANGNTFAILPFDANNDGQLDLFSCAITHGWAGESSDLTALLLNGGPDADPPFRFTRDSASFVRPRADAQRWNQGDVGGATGDLDNDGRPEILVSATAYPDDQRLWIWSQQQPGAWTRVQEAWGVDLRDCGQVSVGDINGDGALDLLCAAGKTRWNKRPQPFLRLYLGTPPAANHWITITLEGSAGRSTAGEPGKATRSNRSAIGARVWVTTPASTFMREVTSAVGHFGIASPMRLHFGLGTEKTITSVRVRWPDAAHTVQTWTTATPDAHYVIRQGTGALERR
ncbi:MAG: CRTAC1 family protein [Planctomycetota bacterium]|jgi:hypothetical protein